MRDAHGDKFQIVHVVRPVDLQTRKSGKRYSVKERFVKVDAPYISNCAFKETWA